MVKDRVRTFYLVMLCLTVASDPQEVAAGSPPALKSSVYAKSGPWTITRYTDAGRKTVFCETIRITEPEKALRFTHSKTAFTFAFMGTWSDSLGSKARVSFWFGRDKANAITDEFTLSVDPEGVPWRTLSESNDEPGGAADALMNSTSISFGYAYKARRYTDTYALAGSNAALKKLFDCGRS